MKQVRDILRFLEEGKLSNRQIAKSCNCSPSTVTAVADRAAQMGITWPVLSRLSDPELEAKLYPQEIKRKRKPIPDYDYVHKELMRKGVTLQLLWYEYKEAHTDGMNYTQFCHRYQTWRNLRKMSMHQIHKVGEKVFVDWAGLTGEVIDQETGEIREVYYFVAALGASDLLFTEVYPDMSLASWIDAHVKAFEYFAGVSEIIVPDNCKTAVKKPCYYEPELNATYAEMASHYGCAVIPARVRKPKDKPLAEGGVQIVERWIIAKLRNQQFFSLHELRGVVRHLLYSFRKGVMC